MNANEFLKVLELQIPKFVNLQMQKGFQHKMQPSEILMKFHLCTWQKIPTNVNYQVLQRQYFWKSCIRATSRKKSFAKTKSH